MKIRQFAGVFDPGVPFYLCQKGNGGGFAIRPFKGVPETLEGIGDVSSHCTIGVKAIDSPTSMENEANGYGGIGTEPVMSSTIIVQCGFR